MSYSTPALVRMALIPSSDGALPSPASNTAADLSDAQLQDAISEADAVIDGYIGGHYAVPVATVIIVSDPVTPHPIDFWSRNIAAYNATLSYRRSLDFPDTDPIARRYAATMTALKAVAAGQIKLQIPTNTSPHSVVGAGSVVNPYAGDLFGVSDFNLRPLDPSWPLTPNAPYDGTW